MNVNFPGDAESFYRLRDDRTQQCLDTAAYQNASCAVTIDDSNLTTLAGRTMLTVSCNLLSRWCRNVTIVMPDCYCEFGNSLLAQMRDADPFGDFRILSTPTCATVNLHIGRISVDAPEGCVSISSSGWHAALSRARHFHLTPSNSDNVIGAIGAACFGVAEVFKTAVGVPKDHYFSDGIVDLFSMRRVTELCARSDVHNGDIGNVLMIGAGSVASAAAYFMSIMNISGRLTIVDFDWVKVENFNRSPVFGRVNFGQRKANALATYLTGSSLEISAISASWNQFVKDGGLVKQYDIWLPLANEEDVRWSMQHNFPPLMIHASTSKNWGVNYGRHWPGIDDCLACRFPTRAVENVLRCSTGPVPTATATVDAALPFLSFFAGLLIVAELARLQVQPYIKTQNYSSFDFHSPLEEIQTWDMKARPECVCQNQKRVGFKRASKYAHLVKEA